ncbi:MAG: DNA-formamidopyrimidine glycosylase family protein [Acidimicrobiales bacterium]|nr:DNA-formamidopyrimidine glycosylase family protein [Acidimicrobiales bacterium]
MPELIEVETYRRQADAVVGRRIVAVPVLDPLGLRGTDPDAVRAELVGLRIEGTARIGKLLLLGTDGPTIGLRFGMTGRLLVDGDADIARLGYGGRRDEPAWDRYVLTFERGDLRIRDPRRLGGLEIDPDVDRLGPDGATITADELATAVAGSTVALKARLLDQRRVAGLGNLLVDETLWRAGLDPGRSCAELAADEVVELAPTIVSTVAELTERGGSHTGDLQEARVPGSACPRDGATLVRSTVGGRTTYHCPAHQR